MFKQRDKRTLNESKDMMRITVIAVLFGVLVLLFFLKLFKLQILNNDYYSSIAVPKNYKEQVIETARGQVFDKNGNVLVSNKKSYNISVCKATLDASDYNTAILKFIDFCEQHEIVLEDKLPVSRSYPYSLDGEYIFDSEKEKLLNKYISDNNLKSEEILGDEEIFYKHLCSKYGISDDEKDKETTRKLVGIRYDMETNDFEYLGVYVLIENIDDVTKNIFAENLYSMHGIEITTSDTRFYNYGKLACHILGTTGKIYKEETEEYVVNKGYDYDSVIGKDGVEKAFEEYLHGFDGVKKLQLDENNNVISETVEKPVKNGYSVKLTLDLELQTAAETALEEQINLAAEIGMSDIIPNNGEDCDSGSIVVMEANTGKVLAMASYPGYDLNTFSKDFNQIKENKAEPLINRSTQGLYPPGSTFKIASAIAGLCSGTITEDTLIYDSGAYKKYHGYSPECWIYSKRGITHGFVDVKGAIKNSCNYFFYKLGDDMGIEELNKYASMLGLGKETGIEIPEYSGILAGPEYRDSVGLLWNPGDTLQAAIGQSDNAFTPLQLCSYMCTVVNGGTRYKATLLDSVFDYYTGETILENKPEVLEKLDIPEKYIELLKSAMKSVVMDGTAKTVFDDYEYEVGGKTGTAQMGKGSDTALFVGFAPYDNPEIVVSVVVENGDQSSRAADAAKKVFDCYFGKDADNTLEEDEENAQN